MRIAKEESEVDPHTSNTGTLRPGCSFLGLGYSLSLSTPSVLFFEYGRDLGVQAWNNYKDNFVKDTAAMAIVWIPLHMVNFRFIPLVHRFPFAVTTGIIWTTVFSFLQFGDVAPSAEPKAA